MYEVESSFGNNIISSLLLDVYATTMPAVSANKALMASSPHATFRVRKNDGITNPYTDYQIDPVVGWLSLENEIKTWLDGYKGLVERWIAPNTGDYYEQTDLTKMPILYNESIGDGSILSRDVSTRVALDFTGNRWMSMPGSTSLFNPLIDGTLNSHVIEFEKPASGIGTMITNGWQTNRRGWGFWSNLAPNYITTVLNNPNNREKVRSFQIGAGGGVGFTVFQNLDITNPTASNRLNCFMNGVEFNTNTATDSTAITVTGSTFNMFLGYINDGTPYYYNGKLTSFIPFDSDQRLNRLDILSYL
jgi:hypothetical protein